jgi:hypothetical protein
MKVLSVRLADLSDNWLYSSLLDKYSIVGLYMIKFEKYSKKEIEDCVTPAEMKLQDKKPSIFLDISLISNSVAFWQIHAAWINKDIQTVARILPCPFILETGVYRIPYNGA